jgi:hypothetical protein
LYQNGSRTSRGIDVVMQRPSMSRRWASRRRGANKRRRMPSARLDPVAGPGGTATAPRPVSSWSGYYPSTVDGRLPGAGLEP